MDISNIFLTFQSEVRICTCNDDDCDCHLETTTTDYKITAQEDKIDFAGLTIIDTTEGMVSHKMCDCLMTLLQLDQPDKIKTKIEFANGQIKTWNHDIHLLIKIMKSDRKVRETVHGSCCDSDCVADRAALYNIYRVDVMNRCTDALIRYSKRLAILDRIKNEECPVLREPLKPTAIRFKKCDHLLSREAYDKLTSTNMGKKCPLCRADHQPHDIDFP